MKNRGIDAESRGSIADTSGEVEVDPDHIQSWEPLVDFCHQLGLPLTVKDESIALYSCNNEVPPKIEFSITINRDFSLSCYRSAPYVPTRELVGGFSGKLELFSLVTHIIDKVKTFKLDIASELKSCKNDLNDLICDSEIEEKQTTQFEFLCEQLNIHCYKTEGQRYAIAGFMIMW